MKPDDPERHFSLGSILAALHRPADALPQFKAAARLNPSDGAYWNVLGGCHLELGEPNEALAAWQQAIRVAPDLVGPYLQAARLQLNLGRFTEARQLLDGYDQRVPAGERHPGARFIADSLAKAGY